MACMTTQSLLLSSPFLAERSEIFFAGLTNSEEEDGSFGLLARLVMSNVEVAPEGIVVLAERVFPWFSTNSVRFKCEDSSGWQ